jgi:two-component system, OmpR family, sensor histidine kinase MprB
MTLRWRITLILAGVALAVGVGAALAAYLSTAAQLRAGIDDTLTSRAAAVNTEPGGDNEHAGGPGGGRDGRPGGPDGGCPTAGSFQPAAAAQLVSSTGAVTVCIDGGARLPVPGTPVAAGTVRLETVTLSGQRYRLLSTPWHEGGTLQIARTLAESDGVLARLRLRLLLMVAIATVVPAVVGWVLATRLTRPIVRLRDTTERIAGTLDLSTPVPTGGSGEVGGLAASFATMVGAVARSREQQRRLVSDASHEMRTPLTSLRSNVELLGRIERLPAGERAAVVGDVLEDIDELAALLAELVELASDTSATDAPEPVSLAELAGAVAARAQRRTGRSITVAAADPRDVAGSPRQLERAIGNLVDNAVKYSPAGTDVEIAVTGTTVTVRDRGRGIAEADRPHIFDRFYRAVEVRTEPGSGLGLSIVDEIVRGHRGRLIAGNRASGGAEVGFTLPDPG